VKRVKLIAQCIGLEQSFDHPPETGLGQQIN
jgi:hypothetical protein